MHREIVLMLHIGRSGSTVLGDLLDQHPSVIWDGEIYHRHFVAWEKKHGQVLSIHRLQIDPIDLLESRFEACSSRLYGFELKPYHLNFFRTGLSQFVRRLPIVASARFVVLKRKNYLRKIVSSLISQQGGMWHRSSDEQIVTRMVQVPLQNVRMNRTHMPLLELLGNYDESFREISECLPPDTTLNLTYEDDLEDNPVKGFHRVREFLALPAHTPQVNYAKTNPFAFNKLVTNFEELEEYLRGTEYEWMLTA
jgi:hypothetical protein